MRAPWAVLWLTLILSVMPSAHAETSVCEAVLHRDQFMATLAENREKLLAVTRNREALERKQSASVTATLRTHGTETPLKVLSRQNLERITQQLGDIPPCSPELEAQIASIQFEFIHNTHFLSENPDTPILSTAALLELGLPGGLNTHWFNREFLRSHDQLFFHVMGTRAGGATQTTESYYGTYGLRPKRAYAIKHGWISPFIMVPGELARFAAVAAKDLGERLAASLVSDPEIQLQKLRYRREPLLAFSFLSLKEQDDWVKREEPLFREIMKRLHLLDFTVSDFEELARRVVRKRIHQDPSITQVDRLLIESSLAIQFGLSFEFKIPVALPAEELN